MVRLRDLTRTAIAEKLNVEISFPETRMDRNGSERGYRPSRGTPRAPQTAGKEKT
jgi:hypothetical protein